MNYDLTDPKATRDAAAEELWRLAGELRHGPDDPATVGFRLSMAACLLREMAAQCVVAGDKKSGGLKRKLNRPLATSTAPSEASPQEEEAAA